MASDGSYNIIRLLDNLSGKGVDNFAIFSLFRTAGSRINEFSDGRHDLLLKQDGQNSLSLPGPAHGTLVLRAPAFAQ